MISDFVQGGSMNNKIVVITGSTRGIGYGLADAFLAQGCSVIVSGRAQESVDQARAELSKRHEPAKITGLACDVSRFQQVQALWDFAVSRFEKVDIWVNNAGQGQGQTPLWELDSQIIESLIDANCKGALFGCKVAVSGMLKQGSGAIYNMEGFGSDGRKMKGLTLYGSSKRALAYITDSLALELKGTGVIVGGLRPGMVATELITKPYEGNPEKWKKVERLFNIVSDRVETVTPWLVRKMLANKKNGVRFKWFSGAKAARRFLAAPFVKRKIFPVY